MAASGGGAWMGLRGPLLGLPGRRWVRDAAATWRLATAAGGGGGRCPERQIWDFRVSGEEEIRKRRGLFIGIEGARRVQMRCVFRPRDRDRTL